MLDAASMRGVPAFSQMVQGAKCPYRCRRPKEECSASSRGEATYAYTITGAQQRLGACLTDDAAGSGRARGLH
jgi:hypothetical protein